MWSGHLMIACVRNMKRERNNRWFQDFLWGKKKLYVSSKLTLTHKTKHTPEHQGLSLFYRLTLPLRPINVTFLILKRRAHESLCIQERNWINKCVNTSSAFPKASCLSWVHLYRLQLFKGFHSCLTWSRWTYISKSYMYF